jgi:2,4-dienoyl-CoA reductase-like NADH-dependent reductase (Old Yellow Enzyme family)/thioredoxin reductase
MNYKNLLSPINIGSLTLRNRVVMGAMGNMTANPDQTISQCSIAYYAERAKGGVGLVINEVTRVNDEHGMMGDRQTSVTSDKFIPRLKELADAVHYYNGAIFLQLHHPGRQTAVPNGKCATPSGVPSMLINWPCFEMSTEQVEELVQQFIDGAERCKKAGIDGVELHAAHGYMLNQFLSPFTNKRTDKYGGNTKKRARIIEEIVTGIRKRLGDYPIMLRISADEFLERSIFPVPEGEIGLKLDESVEIVKYLVPFGIDAVNVSAGVYETMNEAWEPVSYPEGWKIYLAEEIKKAVDVPVFGVGVIRNPEFAEAVIAEGRVDGVTIARGLLADPEWCNKAAEGRTDEIRRCISCLNCMETMQEGINCAVNPRAGREWFYNDLDRNGNGRAIAIIGAGPAGMESALTAAKRGFKVTLFEKSNHLGGQVWLGSRPPHKEKMAWMIEYYDTMFKKLGVDVRLNTAATVEAIKKLNPYAVFVATGSDSIIPGSMPGVTSSNVFSVFDVLSGKESFANKRIAIIGSGLTGMETAELLASQGNTLSIIDMADEIGPGAYWQPLSDIKKHLEKVNPSYYPGHKLLEIKKDGVLLENKDGKKVKVQSDIVVLSLGVRADQSVAYEMEANFDKVIKVGDTGKLGRIKDAVTSGYREMYRLN